MMHFNRDAASSLDSVAQATLSERKTFLFRVYGILSLSLFVAVFGVFVGQNYVSAPGFLLLLVEIALIFAVYALRRVAFWNLASFLTFAAVSGVALSPILRRYQLDLIQEALVLTFLVFGSLSFYVLTSKRDFSFLSSFLFVGLIILLVGGLLNAFLFASPMGEFVLSLMGVFLFSGFILYDTSNILHHYHTEDYTIASLALYLSFINLFLYLLRFLATTRE